MQEGRGLWHFCVAFCASVDYRKRVFERNSHKVTRNAESSSHVGQPRLWVHRLLLQLSSADCLVLSTSLFCLLLLTAPGPSFSCLLQVSWEISRAIPLCGFRAKTDKVILWLAITHTHKQMPNIVSQRNRQTRTLLRGDPMAEPGLYLYKRTLYRKKAMFRA